MSFHATIDPETGCVTSLTNDPLPPAGAIPWPASLPPAEAGRWRWSPGTGWQARPVLAFEQDGNTLTWPDAPAGTRWQVIDHEIGEQLATGEATGAIVISLPDPGQYLVEMEPPLPLVPFRQLVTIEESAP